MKSQHQELPQPIFEPNTEETEQPDAFLLGSNIVLETDGEIAFVEEEFPTLSLEELNQMLQEFTADEYDPAYAELVLAAGDLHTKEKRIRLTEAVLFLMAMLFIVGTCIEAKKIQSEAEFVAAIMYFTAMVAGFATIVTLPSIPLWKRSEEIGFEEHLTALNIRVQRQKNGSISPSQLSTIQKHILHASTHLHTALLEDRKTRRKQELEEEKRLQEHETLEWQQQENLKEMRKALRERRKEYKEYNEKEQLPR